MLHIFLAPGFEEVEALTVIDVLRRCDIEVKIVSITHARQVVGAHGIIVYSDMLFRRSEFKESEGLIFPGGGTGVDYLCRHDGIRKLLKSHAERGKLFAAICAAPKLLGINNLLVGRTATCYPGFGEFLQGAKVSRKAVVEDGNIITGRAVSYAMDFAFAVAARFADADTIQRVRRSMLLSKG